MPNSAAARINHICSTNLRDSKVQLSEKARIAERTHHPGKDRRRCSRARKNEGRVRRTAVLSEGWDQKFESLFLQRGVCELSVPERWAPPRGGVELAEEARQIASQAGTPDECPAQDTADDPFKDYDGGGFVG
jgi:hypothetical protein